MDLTSFIQDTTPLISQRELSGPEVRSLAEACLSPRVADALKAELLTAWAKRGETASELAGFAEALMEGREFELFGSFQGRPLLDCCGTGGGGLPLLNVSTGMMFLLGALGIPVVKHGNRAVTKSSGSADVLEALGLKLELAPGQWTQCLEEVGVTFIFAPHYYASFSTVAPVRKALAAQGQRTIFNLLGPLLNPARPAARLVGVFETDFLALYASALELLCCERYTVALGQDESSGKFLGEASARGLTGLRSNVLKHPDGSDFLVMQRAGASQENQSLEEVFVRHAQESAGRLEQILQGRERGLGRELILVNAALAAWTQGTVPTLEEGLERCTEALDSHAAWNLLLRWKKFSLKIIK